MPLLELALPLLQDLPLVEAGVEALALVDVVGTAEDAAAAAVAAAAGCRSRGGGTDTVAALEKEM